MGAAFGFRDLTYGEKNERQVGHSPDPESFILKDQKPEL